MPERLLLGQGMGWWRVLADMAHVCQSPAMLSNGRAQSVPAWLSLDAKVSYRLIDALELGVSATNLLDGENLLVKNLKFPFDYQSEGRRVFAELVLHF